MSNEKQISRNGKVATLRHARKQHDCKHCAIPIFPDTYYWEVVLAGSGLGSIKFPTRVHAGDCLEKELGGK